MCSISRRSLSKIEKGTVCVCCRTTHRIKGWKRAHLLTTEGRNVAKKLFGFDVASGYCCNRKFQAVKKLSVAQNLESKEAKERSKIRRLEIGKLETVSFESFFKHATQNETYSIISHDTNLRSTIVLKSRCNNTTSKKNRLKVIGSKCIPLNSLILKTPIEETVELMAQKKIIQKVVQNSSWYKSNAKIEKKKTTRKVTMAIRKRQQLVAPLQTFGTNTSLSTAKMINVINSKQTNKEKLSNTYLKSPFSRIRTCFHDPIFEKYVCDLIDSKSDSMSMIATNVVADLKSKSNEILNKIDEQTYEKISKAFENQQKQSIHKDMPTILKYLYIDHHLKDIDLNQVIDLVEKFGSISVVENEEKWKDIAETMKIGLKFSDEICRFGYFRVLDKKPPIRCFQRRNVKLDDDIYMPFFNEKEMKSDMDAWCIGQESESDIDDTIMYSIDQWTEIFVKNPIAVYIGNPIRVPVVLNGQEILVNGVIRNIIPVLIQHMIKCSQKGYLKNVELNQSLTKTSIQILWDENLFCKDGYDFVTKPLPLAYTWCSETNQNVATLSKLLRDQYAQLVDFEMNLNERLATFKLRFMSADYSNASKRWNHKVGGNHRCSKCPINFMSNHSQKKRELPNITPTIRLIQ